MKQTRKTALWILAGAVGLFLIIHYWDAAAGVLSLAVAAAVPLFIGGAIAYIVNILMSFYERHYFPKSVKPFAKASRRPVCLIGALLTVLLVLAVVIWLVLPEIVKCVEIIVSQVPGAVDALASALYNTGIFSEKVTQYLQDIDWQALIEWCARVLIQGVGDTVSFAAGIVSSVIGGAVTVFIALVFAVNLLIRRDKLQSQAKRLMSAYLPDKWRLRIERVLTVANGCFHSYIVGQCTEAVILGTLCALGMWILGFPYAVMTGAVVGITALIPVAGAYIGGAVGFLLILTVSPLKAVLFVVYLVILQQLEGNLIYPRVVGSSVGLPGIWVLAAVTIGGGISGVLGMLLGVPIAATIYKLFGADLRRRERLATPVNEKEEK